jgi:hypothetical protein
MDTAFPGLRALAPGTASLVGSLQYISDTRPRPDRATSSRIREARWWLRHTLITQDHHGASEAVTSFQLSSMEWRDSSVSTRLRKQSPNLEEGVVFDDKCIALSNNVCADHRRPQQDTATALATARQRTVDRSCVRCSVPAWMERLEIEWQAGGLRSGINQWRTRSSQRLK